MITEDSNSGFDFFKIVYGDRCISSYGKSNVYNVIKKYQGRRILAVVDGAAFGCEIKKIMDYLETMRCDCVVYAPESFEFLILASGIIDVPSSVLEKTYDYADSRMYLSWEEFYFSYLSERTRNTVYQYGKSSLGDYYRDEGNVKKIKALIPLSISS